MPLACNRLRDLLSRQIAYLSGTLVVFLAASVPAFAQQCVGMASSPGPSLVQKAQFKLADLSLGQARITFIGHATFLLESPKGVKMVTDYNDYIRPEVVPDIATMNIAHDSHHSMAPDPRIKHLLPGWNPAGGPAQHSVHLQDVHVRNIPTNIRNWSGGTREFGNSIFIFEIGSLCIGHLGHLHHTLTPQQIGQIGQLDVVLVPVDGGYTLDLDGMVEVLKALKAPLMIPMHMFSAYGLERFLARVRKDFEVAESAVPTVVVSRSTLPAKPQVLVLPGR